MGEAGGEPVYRAGGPLQQASQTCQANMLMICLGLSCAFPVPFLNRPPWGGPGRPAGTRGQRRHRRPQTCGPSCPFTAPPRLSSPRSPRLPADKPALPGWAEGTVARHLGVCVGLWGHCQETSVQTSPLDALSEEGAVLSRGLVLEFLVRGFIKCFPSLALLTHLPLQKTD